MNRILLIVAFLPMFDALASAVPPPSPRDMPGRVVSKSETRWLGPSVLMTTRLQPRGFTRITWFKPDGDVGRELTGSVLAADDRLVYDYGQVNRIYGVNDDWMIELPQPPRDGAVTATPDSRFFLYQYAPNDGAIAADLYLSGRKIATLGPFAGGDFALADDGSTAILARKDAGKIRHEIAVFGPDGKERLREELDGVTNPQALPGGVGLLVQSNTGPDAGKEFFFRRPSGKVTSVKPGPNPRFVAWVGNSTTSLMETSIGSKFEWHLIDWSTGKTLLDFQDPNSARVQGAVPLVALWKGYLLIGGLENHSWQDQKDPIRSIYAIDAKTGSVVAHWLPTPPGLKTLDAGRFLQLKDKLYLVCDSEVAELDEREIVEHQNGWREASR